MQILFDFFPLILFAACYYFYDIYVATIAVMGGMSLQIINGLVRRRRLEPMVWIGFLLLLVFGSLTLVLRDERFIQWKPSILYWAMAVGMLATEFIGKRNILERMFTMDRLFAGSHGKADAPSLHFPKHVWRNLNLGWVLGFILAGFLNLYFVYYHEMSVWVAFKVGGSLALTLLYMALTLAYLSYQSFRGARAKPEESPPGRRV